MLQSRRIGVVSNFWVIEIHCWSPCTAFLLKEFALLIIFELKQICDCVQAPIQFAKKIKTI